MTAETPNSTPANESWRYQRATELCEKVRRDLQDATEDLTRCWRGSGQLQLELLYVALATEALGRATASLTLAVERLADMQARP